MYQVLVAEINKATLASGKSSRTCHKNTARRNIKLCSWRWKSCVYLSHPPFLNIQYYMVHQRRFQWLSMAIVSVLSDNIWTEDQISHAVMGKHMKQRSHLDLFIRKWAIEWGKQYVQKERLNLSQHQNNLDRICKCWGFSFWANQGPKVLLCAVS